MLVNLLVLVLFVVLFVAFVWLSRRAWRLRPLALRLPLGLLSSLLALIPLALAVMMARGMYSVYTPRHTPVPDLTVQSTPQRVARGEHLAAALCAACHSTSGQPPLSGGNNLADDFHLPLGNLYPANLTPAGRLPGWSDGQILRALREGIGPDGRPLYGMPATQLRNLSDEDAASIIAYLRSQPATGQQVAALAVAPVGILLVGSGIASLDLPPVTGPVSAPAYEPTAAYGQYIVSYSDCQQCHGADLHGGKPPAPVGPNLTAVAAWTQAGFVKAMRTGVTPQGSGLRPPMPWRQIGTLDDTELAALYEYLKALPN